MRKLLPFLVAGGVQLAAWRLLRRSFRRAQADAAQTQAADAPLPPVSVVVAARDEERHLPALLRALAAQTHPPAEVIVVDDASADATSEIVRDWGLPVRLVQVERPQQPRKKHALTLGIRATRHDLVALTDADCAPRPGWLEALARAHAATPGEALVLGYSPYRPGGSLLNRIAGYETFVTGVLTAASVGLGTPYMAVGRSISYSKTLFDKIGGFAHQLHSLSGDDDLLVQEVQRLGAARVVHVFGAATHVDTDAPPSWRGWLRQKRRHGSAGRHYRVRVQAALALFHGTDLVLYAAPWLGGKAGAALLGIKLAVQHRALREAAEVLDETERLRAFPLPELAYVLYPFVLGPLGVLLGTRRW